MAEGIKTQFSPFGIEVTKRDDKYNPFSQLIKNEEIYLDTRSNSTLT